ncbi:MAG TPA: GGDEF domain-containing protein [Gaiellaceae bacterium]|nr:GGDEF domain-containing protein [Gaiellaceae bacterium]
MPAEGFTIATYLASVALGVLCIGLFLVAMRRIVVRHETVVTAMLHRYDDRLAEFAQTLSDALNHTMPARVAAAISGSPPTEVQDHGVTRMLELARERTAADAAIAVVEGQNEPMLATVGLTEAEAAQVGGMGVPDYRGARAIQVSFNNDSSGRSGASPIRAGLALPLLDTEHGPGMLAVLSRAPDRTFSEIDITSLEDVLTVTRPGIETSLELREPDPVPERDPLTTLYDRPAFHALLDREIARARGRREPLALLILDVDRLTTINAQIGHLSADSVLAKIGAALNDVAGPRDLPCRIGGGRFAVLVSNGDIRDAENLFERLQTLLDTRSLPEIGAVTVSGGIAELLPSDDATALVVRTDAALGLAKGAGRDTVVVAAKR